MKTWYRQWIRLYVFPSGRRMRTFQQVRGVASTVGIIVVADMADAGIALEQSARNKRSSWRTQVVSTNTTTSDAKTVDPQVDRLVGIIYNTPLSATRALGSKHPAYAVAIEFRNRYFPDGAIAITALPYEEELIAVEELLSRLGEKEAAQAIQLFGLQLYIDELAIILPLYRAEIDKMAKKSVITAADVAEASALAQDHLVEMTAYILGALQDKPDIQRQLLEPINAQQEKIGKALALGAKPKDVVPETGEEVDDTSEPSSDLGVDETPDSMPI